MLFVQRDPASGTGSLSFSGDSARVLKDGNVVIDWTTGGSIAGIPQGDGYTLETSSGGVVTDQPLAVGIIVSAMGQSNINHWFDPDDMSTPAADTYQLQPDGSWGQTSGTAARVFASLLEEATGAPVAMFNNAVSDTALIQHSGSSLYWLDQSPGSLYDNAKQSLAQAGGKAELVLWSQGEADGGTDTTTYASALTTMFGQITSDFGDPTILIQEIGTHTTAAGGVSADTYGSIRAAQDQVAASLDNVLIGATTLDGDLKDDVHLDIASRAMAAFRMAITAIEQMGLSSAVSVATGGSDADTIVGGSGIDYIQGFDGNDTLSGGAGDDLITGGNGADALSGNDGNDVLIGGAGNDTLDGGAGDDVMGGGAGDDTYYVDSAGDNVVEDNNAGNDQIFSSVSYNLGGRFVETLTLIGTDNINATGNSSANTLVGNSGNNILDGGFGSDTMIGGDGDDSYYIDSTGDVVSEASATGGTDQVFSTVSYTLGPNLENLTLLGTGNVNGFGNELANTITGNSGNNILRGGAGADTMVGGDGDDTYYVDDPGDVVSEMSATGGTDLVSSLISYALTPNVEKLTLTGTADINGTGNELANIITGNSGANILDGGAGADTMNGGAGNDTYYVDDPGDNVIESSSSGGTDQIFSSVSYGLSGRYVETLTLIGGGDINATGNGSANTLVGNSGANVLDGGADSDTMIGGDGDDTYYVDSGGDVVSETSATGGTDLVVSSISYTLKSNVENLTLTGSANLNGTGNELANTITGNAGNNVLNGNAGADTLDGGAGADTMNGGADNDAYYVDNLGDTVVESSGSGGYDQVFSSVSFTLPANVEMVTLTGADNINATGNGLANTLVGNGGANVLNGGSGADTMVGGDGDDTYYVDNSGDVASETSATGGTDQVISSISYTLRSNVENLTLIGTSSINGTGNELANIIIGNAGNNALNGGAGADTLTGGDGNDTYYVDDPGDVVSETSATGGTDLVSSSISYALTPNVEKLTLTGSSDINGTGNELANTITGNGGANVIDGGAGADAMNGGAGNDTYYVDDPGDVVTESSSSGGTDQVFSSISYTLPTNVENLTLTGTGNINATGNGSANTLVGNSGNNILDGGFGSDTMIGGDGDDSYYIDSTGDVVSEASATGGTDQVFSTVSYTLGPNLENLTLLGTGNVNGFGNELANTITGNSGNNILRGGAGADTMVGGDGDDTYYVDDPGDVVSEMSATGGTDLVSSLISYALTPNVEKLTLTGSSDINGTGNELANTITGNGGANVIDGGAGADAMNGGAGNDTYYVDDPGDVVTESSSSGGTDQLFSSISYTLPTNVENLTLTGTGNINATGNGSANTLVGNSGANVLDGGAGSDTMIGGDGDDTYYVGSGGDVVSETSATGGTDQVISSISYTLKSNVENLTLAGSANLNGTGNELANTITGNAGNNVLNGGAGADTMIGGDGDDTYYIGSPGDLVSEVSASGGTDLVYASMSYALTPNVENLTLTGTGNISGAGNELANIIIGNAGTNVLNGGAGADTLTGGDGNDTYYVDDPGDVVSETSATGGTDLVSSSISYALGPNLENLILTGSSDINGTGNELANTITGNGGANVIDGGAGADTMNGGAGNDTYYVDDPGDNVIESSSSGGTDQIFSSVSYSLSGRYVETLILIGGDNINVTGNGSANTLVGNSGNNVLDGGAGSDTLTGGDGADVFLFDSALGTSNVDTVTDFLPTVDVFELNRQVFGAIAGDGTLDPSAFVIGTAAQDADDRIIYNSATGDIFYDSNGSASGGLTRFAHVAAGTALSASSFLAIG